MTSIEWARYLIFIILLIAMFRGPHGLIGMSRSPHGRSGYLVYPYIDLQAPGPDGNPYALMSCC